MGKIMDFAELFIFYRTSRTSQSLVDSCCGMLRGTNKTSSTADCTVTTSETLSNVVQQEVQQPKDLLQQPAEQHFQEHPQSQGDTLHQERRRPQGEVTVI